MGDHRAGSNVALNASGLAWAPRKRCSAGVHRIDNLGTVVVVVVPSLSQLSEPLPSPLLWPRKHGINNASIPKLGTHGRLSIIRNVDQIVFRVGGWLR